MTTLKRFERAAACRYTRNIMQRRCRRLCLRCAWDFIEGSTRRSRARSQAIYETIRDCPHTNRRPNDNASRDPRTTKAEVCLDCGVGIVTRRLARPIHLPDPKV